MSSTPQVITTSQVIPPSQDSRTPLISRTPPVSQDLISRTPQDSRSLLISPDSRTPHMPQDIRTTLITHDSRTTPISQDVRTPHIPQDRRHRTRHTSRSPGVSHGGIFPKPAIMAIILLLVFVSGMSSGMIEYLATSTISSSLRKSHSESLQLLYGSFAITVLGLLFYPLFGFMADVCCGRYWLVTISVSVMSLGIFLTSIITPLHSTLLEPEGGKFHPYIVILVVCAYLLGVGGVAGFEANVVQFGLDQLIDDSSRRLSLFLHLLVWVRQTGYGLAIVPLTLLDCDKKTGLLRFQGSFQFMPLAIFVLLTIPPLIFLIRMRNSFYRELGSINPYKMVVRIIGYTLKNRHPQRRRSAFFYYYGLNPGRLDFAKVHYGGPYDTEDVENVKTLLQMLVVIVCVGPVFILKVATSYFMYQHLVEHLVNTSLTMESSCYTFWPLMGSGNQMNLIAILLFPVYVVIIFEFLKSIPKILLRLLIGIVMVTLCLVCILLADIAGHFSLGGAANKTINCALAVSGSASGERNSLDMHWGALVAPSVLYGLASPIILTSVFEFICAQSPKSMTGLLVGTFFFVEGVFELIGTLIMVPFSIRTLWSYEDPTTTNDTLAMMEYRDYYEYPYEGVSGATTTTSHTPLGSVACEMWYLAIVVTLGIAGILLFSVAACKYKYRKREESPFPQSDIEDIVIRDIEQEGTQNLLDVASVEVGGRRRERRGRGRGVVCSTGGVSGDDWQENR